MKIKRVSVLGATGSIGKSALSAVKSLGEGYEISGLTANMNLSLFKKQIAFWKPRAVAVHDETTYKKLKSELGSGKTRILCGTEGIREIAGGGGTDIIICAISGAAALTPLLEAVRAKKLIGLASKEPVVMTGSLLVEEAAASGAEIIPVDSEPNALFQCLKSSRGIEEAKTLLITASGGPFRKFSLKRMEEASPEEALAHPAWRMGRKISIDSATMMNKGLEVIEAHNLFGVAYDRIKVVVHPEAKIHSMVEFVDGNILAAMSRTDMRVPIQYALTYPERVPSRLAPLNLLETGRLTFEAPDERKFPGLGLSYAAGKTGGTMPAALNAANEIAVEGFLGGKIKFTAIAKICREIMQAHETEHGACIGRILEIDRETREKARRLVKTWS